MSRIARLPLLIIAAVAVPLFGVSARSNDEEQIRALERRFADAFKAKDADAIMANYEHSQNLVFFDVVPRAEHTGWDSYKKDWQGLFASVDTVTSFDINDLTIQVDGKLAYSSSFQHSIVTTKAGASRDLTVRVTDVYRKSGGKWLIVQEHVSVPVDLQTGKPDLQSK